MLADNIVTWGDFYTGADDPLRRLYSARPSYRVKPAWEDEIRGQMDRFEHAILRGDCRAAHREAPVRARTGI